jgi:hypothetical protein
MYRSVHVRYSFLLFYDYCAGRCSGGKEMGVGEAVRKEALCPKHKTVPTCAQDNFWVKKKSRPPQKAP